MLDIKELKTASWLEKLHTRQFYDQISRLVEYSLTMQIIQSFLLLDLGTLLNSTVLNVFERVPTLLISFDIMPRRFPGRWDSSLHIYSARILGSVWAHFSH